MRKLISFCALGISLSFSTPAFSEEDVYRPSAKFSNSIGLNLFSLLCKVEDNFVFSPFSIYSSFSMLHQAASDETLGVMNYAFGNEHSQEELAISYKRTIDSFRQFSENNSLTTLEINNAIFYETFLPIKFPYLSTLHLQYNAESIGLPFYHPQFTVGKINSWVEEKTNSMIKDFLPQDSLDPDSMLVLVNTVLLKASWNKAFMIDETKKGHFYLSNDKQVPVSFMRQKIEASYYKDSKLTAAEIPFQAGSERELGCLFLLPNSIEGLREIENSLSEEYLDKILGQLSSQKLVVTIPKFRLESSLNLSNMLKQLGLALIFSDAASFPHISEERDFKLSQLIHKAVFDCQEKGIDASAASACIINQITSHAPEFREIHFSVNRPFLFFIIDKKTKNILFLGRLISP